MTQGKDGPEADRADHDAADDQGQRHLPRPGLGDLVGLTVRGEVQGQAGAVLQVAGVLEEELPAGPGVGGQPGVQIAACRASP